MTSTSPRDGQSCPACGMIRALWPDEGYVRDGVEYCCQGCAEGSGCNCPQKNAGEIVARSSDVA